MTGITEGRLPLKIASQGLSGMLNRLKTITLIINTKAIVIAGLAVLSTFLARRAPGKYAGLVQRHTRANA